MIHIKFTLLRRTLLCICALGIGNSFATASDAVASKPLGAAAVPGGVALGMNFNFTNLDQRVSKSCDQGSDGRVQFGTTPRLVNYGDAKTRSTSQADLRLLMRQGVTWVRSTVWFSPSEVPSIAFMIGRDDDKAVRNIQALGSDLAAAGVSRWILVFGPQGTARPSCRRKEYGDCYDPATNKAAIDFIISARRALDKVPHPELWIDLYNEGCPDGESLKNKVNSARKDYSRNLIARYHAMFPDDRLTISCVGDKGLWQKLSNVEALFREVNISPAFYDAHIYARPNRNISGEANALARWSASAKKPAIVGETNIARPDVKSQILEGFSAANASPLAIIHWPLNNSMTHCGVDRTESLE